MSESFLLLSSTPLDECIKLIFSSVDGYLFPVFSFLRIRPIWIFLQTFFLSKYLGLEWLVYKQMCVLLCKKLLHSFSEFSLKYSSL